VIQSYFVETAMRKPQGYATVVGDLRNGTPTVIDHGIRHTEGEIDTFVCNHCNRVVHVPPRQDAANIGGLCKCCMNLICARCVDKGTCIPFERKLEEAEARQRLRDAASA